MSDASLTAPPTAKSAGEAAPAPSTPAQTDFDETFYLNRYPDVAAAVKRRGWKSGWHHYVGPGRREGRQARILGFDEAFYVRSYPQVAEEIAAGSATNPVDHYTRFGKARGYLPNATAARPENPSASKSRFGGLWPDLPDALDRVEGKLETGLITETQADLLKFWIRHGYVILEAAVPDRIVDAARVDLDRAYSGRLPNQHFECEEVIGSRAPAPWREEMNACPTKALDIHFHSAAIRDAIFAGPITDFLALIFESRALASQSLGFWRGSAQSGHQDSAYVAYSMSRSFAASWIALEDVAEGAGELFYLDGSHVLDDYLYGDQFKTIYDYRRANEGRFPTAEVGRFVESLRFRAEQKGMHKRTFPARKGDALIWHADLVHGGSPISNRLTRKSVVTHYCPRRLAPLYFENGRAALFEHGKDRFSTIIYSNMNPGQFRQSDQ